MVVGVITKIAQIGQVAWRYRHQIYRVVSAQDRAINSALKIARVSKATRYGIRHGLVAGTTIGSLISYDNDGTDDGIPAQSPKSTTRPSNKTYGRKSARSSYRYPNKCYPDKSRRRSNYSKQRRS